MSDTPQVFLSKVVREYPLPASEQTHEIIAVGGGLLLVSQQPDSSLVKVALDPATGRPRAAAKFTVGSPFSGLHGLCASRAYPGKVWATLQFDSALLLLDPMAGDLDAPPQILKRFDLPAPARGPHGVIEHGGDLWTTCKDSHHVVRIGHSDPSDISVHPCSRRPIFAAVHPTSGDLYASLDQSSKIFRLEAGTGATEEIEILAEEGTTPVGLIAGPEGNVWFVLLGDSSGGHGTFGRITAESEIDWFQLKSTAGTHAGLIHLAFGAPSADGTPLRLYLLGSTMASHMALDAVFAVTFEDGSRIATETTLALPSQPAMTHRVLVHRNGLFVTALGVSSLAHIEGSTATGDRVIDETADAYSLFGLGSPDQRFDYAG